MRRATNAQPGEPQQGASAEARRAAERLREAQDALRGMRQQESGNELSDLSRRADQLAGQHGEFVKKMQQVFGSGGEPRPQPGTSREQVESHARDREQMSNDLNRLENDMQGAVRNLAGTQRNASSKLREALGEMQQNELKLRMKLGAEWLRRGLGQYLPQRGGPLRMGLERLRDQVNQAQAAAGSGQQRGANDGMERALNQVERMREQLERMMGQRGQGRQQGQGQGRGQQGSQGQEQAQGQDQGQGQQGQGQRGQGGQGGRGQQQADGRGGGQSGGDGDFVGGGGQGTRSGRDGFGTMSNLYRSGSDIPQQGVTNPGIERAMREGLRDLSELRQQVRESPELAADVADIMREIQKYDPARIDKDPLLAERIRSSVLPAVQQLELQLRRKLESGSDDVRTTNAHRVPAGYGDAVAEYFRKLSQTGK
jgi:hypothetical protein